MDCHESNRIRFGQGRLVAFALVFLFCFRTALADDPPVLEISPDPIRAGSQFTLSFLIRHSSTAEILIPSDVRFPSSAVLLGGPGITPVTVRDPVTGAVERRVKVQYVFRASRAGRSILGPIPYILQGSPHETSAVVLEIAQQRGPPLVPFDLDWRVTDKSVYEGQTIAAVLEMGNLTGIAVPESVSINPPKGAVFEEAKGIGTIQSVKAGIRELYRVPIASYLLTPQSAGRLVIPAAKVSALGTVVSSESLTVTVRPLPESVKATGAVGTFRISSRLDRSETFANESFHLFIRIEGEGNLHFLQLPEFEFPDFEETGRTDRTEAVAAESGYRGFREWDLRLIPKNTGTLRLGVPPFSWFDPETEKTVSSPTEYFSVSVREPKGADKKADDGPIFRILRADAVLRFEPLNGYKIPFMYGLFLPGTLLLGYGLYRRGRGVRIIAAGMACFLLLGSASELKQKSLAFIDKGAVVFDGKEYFEAVKQFTLALDGLPDSPGIHYNLGLSHKALNNVPRALFHLRKASRMNPGVPMFRAVLSAAEKEYGLSRQIPLPGFHPDRFFWILLFVYTLLCSLPLIAKRRGMLVIGLLLLSLPAVLALAGLLHYSAVRDSPWGIVGRNMAELRKIPLPNASEWIYLEEGTAVEVKGNSSGYLLVKTGFGVEGWIDADKMLVDWGK